MRTSAVLHAAAADCARAVLAHELPAPARAALGLWKYLAIEDNEYLFNLAQDERERAKLAARERDRLFSMREQYRVWADKVRPASSEARSELVYTERDTPAR